MPRFADGCVRFLDSTPRLRLRREALTARAAVPDVRVVELEARAHESAHEIDLGSGEQHHALGVDDQPDAVALEYLVRRRLGLTELHEVRVARTPAAAHADAKR